VYRVSKEVYIRAIIESIIIIVAVMALILGFLYYEFDFTLW